MRELEGNVKHLKKRLVECEVKLKAATKEVALFNELNCGLISNQKVFRDRLAAADQDREAKAAMVQVSDSVSYMMMYLFTTVPHPHGHRQLQELLGNHIYHSEFYLFSFSNFIFIIYHVL